MVLSIIHSDFKRRFNIALNSYSPGNKNKFKKTTLFCCFFVGMGYFSLPPLVGNKGKTDTFITLLLVFLLFEKQVENLSVLSSRGCGQFQYSPSLRLVVVSRLFELWNHK